MAETEGRKALHAYVSDDAHEHWHEFCAEQGISVSALLEALAPALDIDSPASSESKADKLATLITEARKIDAARRRRRRS